MDKLNPGCKFATLLLVSLLLSFAYNIGINLAVFTICILFTLATPSASKKKLLFGLLPFLLTAAGLFMSGYWFPSAEGDFGGSWGAVSVIPTSVYSGLQLSSRVLAFGGIGVLFALTTSSQQLILSLMQQFRLPPKFAYGILAAYHFIPVARQEYKIVRAAQKVRGVKAGPFSRKVLLPMLVHAFSHAENIAIAMESRGFYEKAERKIYNPPRVKWGDIVFFLLFVGGTMAALFYL